MRWGNRARGGGDNRTVLQKGPLVIQKPGWKGLALPQVCKRATVTSCGKASHSHQLWKMGTKKPWGRWP